MAATHMTEAIVKEQFLFFAVRRYMLKVVLWELYMYILKIFFSHHVHHLVVCTLSVCGFEVASYDFLSL